MKYYNVYIDGSVVSRLTTKEVDSEIKKLVRKNYQVFDCRKKDLIVINMLNENQPIALIGNDKK